ncbi:MAG: hydrogenase formation protein HypD [Magnetococcales bacterium]|nr:hydrogenase formation protein HypD [Magnetococcales bacterium]
MKGLSDPALAGAARRLTESIQGLGARLASDGRTIRIMEVCGTHTMAIARSGLRHLLPANVILTSGPGCPVCVTGPGYIDAAYALAEQGAIIVTFGDLIRVPGSRLNLAEARARGGEIHVCYSPMEGLRRAQESPDRQVVFLAIGFETTAAPIVAMLDLAVGAGVENLSLLTAFKCVPPALTALIGDPEIRIDGFLCPGHVSAIIGAEAYRFVAETHHIPCVVAGFEPLDILLAIEGILSQLVTGQSRVDNQYQRVVRPEGNLKIQSLMERYLTPADVDWRGIGVIPQSGLALRPAFRTFDAEARFDRWVQPGKIHGDCQCGEVLKGKITPPECRLFRRGCHPDHPIGPCMVSSEGTCAAWFHHDPATHLVEDGHG